MNLSKETYLKNPCRASALPYWKAVRLAVPEDILVLHECAFHAGYLTDYTDEPYFRLYHDLQGLPPAVLPDGLQLFDAAPADYGAHISRCYTGMSAAAAEVGSYVQHSVYSADLWVAVRDGKAGKLPGPELRNLMRRWGKEFWNGFRFPRNAEGAGSGLTSSRNFCTGLQQKRNSPRFPDRSAILPNRKSCIGSADLRETMSGTS